MRQIITFLKEARAEFKRVTWPTRAKTIQLTTAVFTVIVGVALLVAFFDYLFNLMVQMLVGR